MQIIIFIGFCKKKKIYIDYSNIVINLYIKTIFEYNIILYCKV